MTSLGTFCARVSCSTMTVLWTWTPRRLCRWIMNASLISFATMPMSLSNGAWKSTSSWNMTAWHLLAVSSWQLARSQIYKKSGPRSLCKWPVIDSTRGNSSLSRGTSSAISRRSPQPLTPPARALVKTHPAQCRKQLSAKISLCIQITSDAAKLKITRARSRLPPKRFLQAMQPCSALAWVVEKMLLPRTTKLWHQPKVPARSPLRIHCHRSWRRKPHNNRFKLVCKNAVQILIWIRRRIVGFKNRLQRKIWARRKRRNKLYSRSVRQTRAGLRASRPNRPIRFRSKILPNTCVPMVTRSQVRRILRKGSRIALIEKRQTLPLRQSLITPNLSSTR